MNVNSAKERIVRAIQYWSLNRIIVLLLLGGLASLMIDIRWEHRVELGRQWQTWIPLVYIGLMLIAGVVGLYKWNSWGRRVLQIGFSVALIVGALGVWFHSKGDPVGNFRRVLTAWVVPVGTNGGVKIGSTPPELAPLAFMGLGVIGLLACSRRFQCDPPTSNELTNHERMTMKA
jgi:hypothetical protein